MGAKRFRTTSDLVRFGANLRVACACGHVAVIDGHELDQLRRERRWPLPLGYTTDKLRCSRCGRRPASALPSPSDPTVRVGPTLSERVSGARARRDEP